MEKTKMKKDPYHTKSIRLLIKIFSLFGEEENIVERYTIVTTEPNNLKLDKLKNEHLQDVLDIFRFVLFNKEFSTRAFLLSEVIIRFIPSHYSAFDYRKSYILKVKEGAIELEGGFSQMIENEFKVLQEITKHDPKSFQVIFV